MSTALLEVSLLGVGTVLRLERDAWSVVKRLRQATNEYAPPSPFANRTDIAVGDDSSTHRSCNCDDSGTDDSNSRPGCSRDSGPYDGGHACTNC